MSVSVRRTLPEESWRRFVEQHPAGNIFHTPEMFRVFSLAKGHKPLLWAAVNDDGSPLSLLLPVQITLFRGILAGLTTRAVAYGGMLCADSPIGGEALATLANAYRQQTSRNVLFTELRNLSDLSGIQAVLAGCGFAHEAHLNFLIDLQRSETELWANVSKSGRQSVRTSRNKGMVIEEATDCQQIGIGYELLQKVYARAGVPLADLTLFQAAFDVLAPQRMFKAFLARAGKHYIGAVSLLTYKERVLTWYAGSDRTFSSHCPTEALIWHAIQWSRENGFRIFDFGGAGKPDEDYGPRDFKAKFGGRLVDYGRAICIHAPTRLKLSQAGYQAMRHYGWRWNQSSAKGSQAE